MKDNIIVKRLCIFFVGLVIGLIAGHNHGVVETEEHYKKRILLDRKPHYMRWKERNVAPPPREKSFFDEGNRVPR